MGEIVFKLIVGGGLAYVALRIGFWILRGLANPLPGPPPAGEMRRLKLGYRCTLCGVELRITAAPDQDPPPPRHCQEDMELVSTGDDGL